MSTITKISAFYRELIPGPADYQNREASATIDVDCSEEGDDLGIDLNDAMDQARSTVRTYLGLGAGKGTGAANSSTSGSTKPPATSKGNISDNPEDRTDPDADEETPAEAKKRKTAATRKANAAKKKAAEAEAAATAEAESEGEDDDFGFDGDGETEELDEITDDDLQKAANAVVVRLQGEGLEGKEAPAAVSEVIKGFKPEDHEGRFGISMVKQKARRKFMEMIDALQGPDAD